ncbi:MULTISPECIES: hypothetical protein [unclassified Undibacterium]|uniref:hypothetical protein n=1 Tax=unclassified Undibacterium TaxID=2630295 RepID=UPI002AC8C303|nr:MULTISPECIES: hypothetical protein [unclassified Undibacterium]MEB0140182.1 hypothetical protein [Undibacterium sp. CCC2.1]MEB0172444.1 hypothetical protein [Undibacterium sp. CCC1.1]MEB0176962.1 hypothetical protein [Undibacterium sp. CCC3.4]MEB0215566.1 hypothetical protein [Undibacterium sp. 5I2]WPX43727.1 hypothetical protein RHM61_00360 [Undibacterium sp. CCC3.4]
MYTPGLAASLPQAPLNHAIEGTAGIDGLEIRAALAQVLDSAPFVKSRRMCLLLRFLIEKQLANAIRDITEYSIGIEVFERDPASYNTGEDPIVRVQIGRLREKLKAFYATMGHNVNLHITIPLGHYMPVIRRSAVRVAEIKHRHRLAAFPLKYLSDNSAGVCFTEGLSEELSHQLFREFGDKIVSHTFARQYNIHEGDMADAGLQAGVSHFLEGSIRVEGHFIRTSFRMLDAKAGCIAWSIQCDHQAAFSIHLQEAVASSVCASLEQYFAGR